MSAADVSKNRILGERQENGAFESRYRESRVSPIGSKLSGKHSPTVVRFSLNISHEMTKGKKSPRNTIKMERLSIPNSENCDSVDDSVKRYMHKEDLSGIQSSILVPQLQDIPEEHLVATLRENSENVNALYSNIQRDASYINRDNGDEIVDVNTKIISDTNADLSPLNSSENQIHEALDQECSIESNIAVEQKDYITPREVRLLEGNPRELSVESPINSVDAVTLSEDKGLLSRSNEDHGQALLRQGVGDDIEMNKVAFPRSGKF